MTSRDRGLQVLQHVDLITYLFCLWKDAFISPWVRAQSAFSSLIWGRTGSYSQYLQDEDGTGSILQHKAASVKPKDEDKQTLTWFLGFSSHSTEQQESVHLTLGWMPVLAVFVLSIKYSGPVTAAPVRAPD